MVRAVAVVKNAHGVHARPSSIIAREASKFDSAIYLRLANVRANAKKIIHVLSLGADKDDEIVIEVHGPDEKQALQTMKALLETEFAFGDPR
jgi:phosphocarrier protein